MTTTRPFRFGVLGESGRVLTREGLTATAHAAEATGYATFLIRDHVVEAPFGHQLAPLAALATVAAVTERLRVGTLVFANDYRHPAILAKEAATLDLLSGGRFELGIGAGWLRDEYEQAGLAFDRAGVRIDRLEEALRVLKGLFAEGPLALAGDHYAVTGLDGFPKPVQRPHPPILIGAGAPRMLALAGREADTVGILTASVASGTVSTDPTERFAENVARKADLVREAARDRPSPPELSLVASVVLADDHRRAAERYAAERGWDGVTADQMLGMPSLLIGSADRIADELAARRERFGFSYVVVSDADADAFAPVVARLAGR